MNPGKGKMMTFSEDQLKNCVYHDQPLAFNPLLAERTEGMAGEELETGALVQENGDVLFRVYAPEAAKVEILVFGTADRQCRFALTKGEDGVFEGLYPYDPTYCGPHSLDVLVDGTCFLDPFIPIMWHRNRPVNFLEVPDPDTRFIEVRDVPHGAFTREIYWSGTLKTWQRALVYTPPGYQKSGLDYPVLYLQHGSTENETCWEYNGRLGYILDNLIAEGAAEPFLVVMNDGMVRFPGESSAPGGAYTAFEGTLISDCIPFIEETYRVRRDKNSRAIAGLSMGSSQALRFGLSHPDLFAYIGVFSGSLYREGMDETLASRAFDADFIRENYRVYFRSIGDAESRTAQFWEESEKCEACGIKALSAYHEAVYPYQTHEWGCWRRAIHDFAQLLFKD